MYMIFLILYSYMLLFGYKEQVTPVEWLVIAWLSTMIIESIRQVNKTNNLAKSIRYLPLQFILPSIYTDWLSSSRPKKHSAWNVCMYLCVNVYVH